jgi:hypothetical protein
MMNNYHLYATLLEQLSILLPHGKAALIANLALMVLALAQSADCHLATLATVLPLEGQRENLIQRLRRWLKNRRLSQRVYYVPLVKYLFAHWQGDEVALVMDRTDLNDRWSLLVLGVAYGKRTLPLARCLLPFGATKAELQIKLLKQIQPWLPDPKKVRITFFGDAEFRAVEVQRYCRRQGWHWQVGVKSDTLFRHANGPWQPLSDLPIAPGQRLYVQKIFLTREHNFGLVNLIVDWNPEEDTPRYIVLDQKADGQAWRRGRKRFWIEPTFRDWKSYGFDLEKSKLRNRRRLENMVLAMAVTTLWMIYLGQALTDSDQRTLLEADHKQDYSLFRLGRDWLRRSLALGQPIPVGFSVTP